ncbi:hypothetical protein [Chitinophaga japonensis]|uniref:Uncharacterized protein n=1 Tax=Chitinophaga japonensis TaxID=104662 RepID=A0A562SYE7_CHIJA|nr:hypothetical protein [Chitinophaga japonensis]TWI86332.1 hypothetical protein LX66_3586 [Chitinophaga japonensis]
MDEKMIDHKVTAEDLKNNPELAEQGVEEGEVIGIPAENTEAPADGAALTGEAEQAD